MRWFLVLFWFLLPPAVGTVDIYPAQPTGVWVKWQAEEPPEMATVTKNVYAGAELPDYDNVGSALAWFVSNHDFDTDGIARILITDATSYTQSSTLDLTGISGTPDIDGHLEITSDATDPFSGPTINMTHGSNGGYLVNMEYTYIHNLTFHLNNTSISTECIRVAGLSDNVLISRNVFIALNQTSGQDGIYTGNWSVANLRMDNNVFIGFARGAIHLQAYGGTAYTQSVDLDHNSISDHHTSGEGDGGGVGTRADDGGTVININVFNTLVFNDSGASTSDNYHEYTVGTSGTVNWSGSNNIAEDASAEAKFTSSYDSVTFTESSPSSGENAWLTEIDSATETDIDLSIVGENAYTVTGNGTDRTGSEPDSRQDFSVDIMGNSRDASTPDIGAFEYVVAGAATSFIPPATCKLIAHLLVR